MREAHMKNFSRRGVKGTPSLRRKEKKSQGPVETERKEKKGRWRKGPWKKKLEQKRKYEKGSASCHWGRNGRGRRERRLVKKKEGWAMREVTKKQKGGKSRES